MINIAPFDSRSKVTSAQVAFEVRLPRSSTRRWFLYPSPLDPVTTSDLLPDTPDAHLRSSPPRNRCLRSHLPRVQST